MPSLEPPNSETLVRPPALCLQPPTPVPSASPGLAAASPFLSSSSFDHSQTLSVQPQSQQSPRQNSTSGAARAPRQRTVSASECDAARAASLPPDPLRSANNLTISHNVPGDRSPLPGNSPLFSGSSRHSISCRPKRHRSLLSLLMRKTVEELQATNGPLGFRRSAESGDTAEESTAGTGSSPVAHKSTQPTAAAAVNGTAGGDHVRRVSPESDFGMGKDQMVETQVVQMD